MTVDREVVRSYLDTLYEIAGGSRKEFLRRIEEIKGESGFDVDHEEVQWVLSNWDFDE